MTDIEMRIKIAQHCGWYEVDPIPDSIKDLEVRQRWMRFRNDRKRKIEVPVWGLPDYLNSLDAMHEAEETLTREEQDLYEAHLDSLVPLTHETAFGYFHLIHAKPRLRAEAFLKTKEP